MIPFNLLGPRPNLSDYNRKVYYAIKITPASEELVLLKTFVGHIVGLCVCGCWIDEKITE